MTLTDKPTLPTEASITALCPCGCHGTDMQEWCGACDNMHDEIRQMTNSLRLAVQRVTALEQSNRDAIATKHAALRERDTAIADRDTLQKRVKELEKQHALQVSIGNVAEDGTPINWKGAAIVNANSAGNAHDLLAACETDRDTFRRERDEAREALKNLAEPIGDVAAAALLKWAGERDRYVDPDLAHFIRVSVIEAVKDKSECLAALTPKEPSR
jgi:uncharacterized coiled-coil protein SlyX